MISAGRKLLTRVLPAAMLALVLTSAPPAAEAAATIAPHDQREMSREEAARLLQQRYGSAARVVRTDEVDEGGRRVYVFRLLSVNGRVWIVHIDAKSGSEIP